MSTTRRIISGSLAGWTRMVVVLVTQLAAVPIYLSCWSVELYGLWLLLHAAVLMLPIFDAAHHQYLDGEFLKTGHENISKLNGVFWGGLGVSVVVGGVQFAITMGLIALLHAGFVPEQERHIVESNIVPISVFLGVYALLWWCIGSTGGILVRFLSPLGYYPRVAWWFVAVTLLESVAPATVVWFGGTLMAATIAFLVTFFLIRVAVLIDATWIAVKNGLGRCEFSWRDAWVRLGRSTLLAVQQGTDSLRQQGMRLLLSPLAGTVEMTHFATVRVGVNSVSQGFTAISAPLMPELMRFVRFRDQAKIEASFATLWVLVLVVVIPACLVLQFIGADLISLWTGGKIRFDPIVFSLLTLGTILFAISQPSWVLVRSNNLLKAQLTISVVSMLVLLSTLFLAVPAVGIRGAAFGAFITEAFCMLSSSFVASSWLKSNGLRFPGAQFRLLLVAVLLASIAYLASFLSIVWAIALVALTALAYGWLLIAYWQELPSQGRSKIYSMIDRFRFRSGSPLPVVDTQVDRTT